MPAASAIGGALLAYGPSAAFFFGFVSPRSQLLVMCILSAFVWVLAISVAGLVWAAIPPLQGATGFHAPVAILLQELGRFALAKIHVKAEPFIVQLLPAADPMGWNDLSVALASGVGFGTAHAVTMHAGAIIASGGLSDALPGSTGACPASLWVLSPVQALLEVAAHTALMVVAFDIVRRGGGRMPPPPALSDSTSAVAGEEAVAAAPSGSERAAGCGCCGGVWGLARWAAVLAVHLLWSLPSLASAGVRDACLWAAAAQLVATVAAAAWAGLAVTASDYYPAQRAGRADVLAAAERARRVREAQAEARREAEEAERLSRREAVAAAEAAEAAEGDGVRQR